MDFWRWIWEGSVSDIGREIEALYGDLLWLFVPLVLIAVVYVVVAAVRFRHRPGRTAAYTRGGLATQLIWTLVAGGIVYLVGSPSLELWADVRGPESEPDPFARIRMVVDDEGWVATYAGMDGELDTPDDYQLTDPLVLPLDRPVFLHIESDELRTFSLRGMRVKRDILPGTSTLVWFEPDIEGEFPIGCDAECAPSFRAITGTIDVKPADPYRLWRFQQTPEAYR